MKIFHILLLVALTSMVCVFGFANLGLDTVTNEATNAVNKVEDVGGDAARETENVGNVAKKETEGAISQVDGLQDTVANQIGDTFDDIKQKAFGAITDGLFGWMKDIIAGIMSSLKMVLIACAGIASVVTGYFAVKKFWLTKSE